MPSGVQTRFDLAEEADRVAQFYAGTAAEDLAPGVLAALAAVQHQALTDGGAFGARDVPRLLEALQATAHRAGVSASEMVDRVIAGLERAHS
jgi:hypothetical protein